MADPNGTGDISVTLKQDSRDGTWMVFRGSNADEVKANLVGAFPALESLAGDSLHDVVLEATRLYKATGNASKGLGARPASSAWNPPAKEEKVVEPPTVAELIEGTTNVTELKQVWAENKAEFDKDPSLMDAYKAKGKALTST